MARRLRGKTVTAASTIDKPAPDRVALVPASRPARSRVTTVTRHSRGCSA